MQGRKGRAGGRNHVCAGKKVPVKDPEASSPGQR